MYDSYCDYHGRIAALHRSEKVKELIDTDAEPLSATAGRLEEEDVLAEGDTNAVRYNCHAAC